MAYTDISEHQWMIEDRARTGAYEEAIRRGIGPADTVLDFGCGLGILAMFAAKAGARKVYAVDRLPIVRLAHEIAKANGFSSIDFMYEPGHELSLPEKVNVIVSEWMGHFALREGMLGPLCDARDRLLLPGGRMIPERVTMKAALVRERGYHEKRCFFKKKPYGLDFSSAAQWAFSELSNEEILPEELLWPSATMATLDLATIKGPPALVEGELVPESPCTVYGIAGWFEADLGQGVRLDAGPLALPTHWQQLFFPFAEPWSVDPARPVKLRMTPVQLDDVQTRWQWWAGDGVSERSGDDLMLRAHLRRPLSPGLLK
jgi:protein arginine N-methyltransferase 1